MSKTPAVIQESLRFMGRFLATPGSVGAVLPSSRYLAHMMVRDLDLAAGDLIVEYGPGTGPMTRALESLHLGDRGIDYLGIELDEQFHASLSARMPELSFHHGSVEDVEQILEERGLGQVRAIISGLPFACLPDAVQTRVVRGSHAALCPGGEFRTFQYVHAYPLPAARRFRTKMAEQFRGYSRSAAVIRNVPPAYKLTYRKS